MTPSNDVLKNDYDFDAVEQKWRAHWQQISLYATGDDPQKPDYYILDYFPYPSGDGLSVGHCRNYVPTCVDARYHRMNGFNVLHPMGWDAFGLPAENYAIKHGIHPRESTKRFCDTYRRQMKLVECSYDWSREINSTHPGYYRWTQYFFLLLHQRGLAHQAVGSQWWCPNCLTILANEQVENGRCWRCNSLVVRKELRQWYFKITDYADRLIADLDTVDWPEPIKMMQKNWIGRSEGADITFTVDSLDKTAKPIEVAVFTTRPDTLFGVTFLLLAPEHLLVERLVTSVQAAAVSTFVRRAALMTDTDRQAAGKEKSGVFTGAYARHPLTGENIPIWIADYVLTSYGSGAVMGVPGHDTRDYAFAQKYELPIINVVVPEIDLPDDDPCYTGHGTMINSGIYNGMSSVEGSHKIVAELEARAVGSPKVTYRMRDWLISRQRYWGVPIPIIHCPQCGPVPVPEDQLPVLLPDTSAFAPTGDGRSPLARVEDWVNTSCPQCDSVGRRETDTMDGFACSSWYFLRFASPRYQDGPFDLQEVRRWLPVDMYVGGAEHAVMHLLYSRFWTKVMYDAGLISFSEPFSQLRNQGMLLSSVDGQKMSKSKRNVVTPDEVVAKHGTDALRAYVLFLGPFDAEVTWNERGIKGITRFLDRYLKMATWAADQIAQPDGDTNHSREFQRRRHQVIKRVTADMSRFRYNTAVAALMEYLNYLSSVDNAAVDAGSWRQAIETMTLLLAPICPFITEEIWHSLLGHEESVHRADWPRYDEAQAADEQVIVVVQVNGKLRDRLQVSAELKEDALRELALTSANVQKHIAHKRIRQVVVVPLKLVNIVV